MNKGIGFLKFLPNKGKLIKGCSKYAHTITMVGHKIGICHVRSYTLNFPKIISREIITEITRLTGQILGVVKHGSRKDYYTTQQYLIQTTLHLFSNKTLYFSNKTPLFQVYNGHYKRTNLICLITTRFQECTCIQCIFIWPLRSRTLMVVQLREVFM